MWNDPPKVLELLLLWNFQERYVVIVFSIYRALSTNTVDSVKHGVDRTRVNDMTDSWKRTCQCLWREESTWVWQRRQAAILCWSCTWTPRERRTLSRCPPQWTVPRWWSKGCLRCWGRQWRSWPTCWRVSWRRGWWGRGGSCQRGQRSRWVPSKQLLQRMQHLCGQTNTLPWCYQSPAGMCSSCILQRARHRPCREESQPASDLTSAFLLSWIIPARQYSSAATRQQCALCNLYNTDCTVLTGGRVVKEQKKCDLIPTSPWKKLVAWKQCCFLQLSNIILM